MECSKDATWVGRSCPGVQRTIRCYESLCCSGQYHWAGEPSHQLCQCSDGSVILPSWGEVLEEITVLGASPTRFDDTRRKYLVQLHQKTGRAVILYATRFTQPSQGIDPSLLAVSIGDIQGLMEVMKGMACDELDLVLHSPGGSIDAAEALVTYIRSKFKHVRAIVPHAAMSAASMIACSADEIVMGKHSFLGPFDPQFVLPTPLGNRMVPAQAVLEQFERAQKECVDPSKLASWVPMLSQYGPDLLIQCQNASDLSRTLVAEWLKRCMLRSDPDRAEQIAEWLSTHQNFKSHSRFLPRSVLQEKGLNVKNLEDDQELQDIVLSLFHATTHTFSATAVAKIIENHQGKAYLSMQAMTAMPGPGAFFMPIPPGEVPPPFQVNQQ